MIFPNEMPELPVPYKDRNGGLITFGILTTLMGGLFALLLLLMLVMTLHPPASMNADASLNVRGIIPVAWTYGLLAVALVWLGVGSMRARRWARALLLIFSWSWLITGIITLGIMIFMLPRMTETMRSAQPAGQPPLPEATAAGMASFMVIFTSVIFVILPTVWVLFYQSKHVKATCEARDPVVRWTDRCPLPVLAISLWLGICAPMMLMMATAYRGVIPVFGTFVSGPLGSALYVVNGLLWGYAAWALYKLDRKGWWIIFASLILFSISAFITYSRHDVSELYTLMGYPEAQIAQLKKMSIFEGQTMAWTSLLWTVPFLGYLLYIRRFVVAGVPSK